MRPLEEIIEEYENTRESFKNFTKVGDANKDTLLEYQQRFLDLKADLRPWHTKMMHASEMRSDKGATAIKMRIAVAMVKDEYEFGENEKPMYDKPPSITNADKFAAATRQYKEFLDQRTFHKESFVNVADLREDLQGYITLCRDRQNK
jgi:hypothetical protein